MPSLRKPRVVFTTGPGAFREGYISFLELTYPHKSKEEILESGVWQGKLGKQIRKVGMWNWLNDVGSENVVYDGTNWTKKERDHKLAGSYHWFKMVYQNREGLDFSCREYLYQLDHNSTENEVTANWTVFGR